LLLLREILNKIINDVTDVDVLKRVLDCMKPDLFFKGNSLIDLLNEMDISLETIKECYLNLMKTGSMGTPYFDKVTVDTCIFFLMTSHINSLHRQLGNSYSSFALIFDTDKSLGFTSKKAINDHINARTEGYKIYVVCERLTEKVKDQISEEVREISLPNWPKDTLQGGKIQVTHDYAIHDYTDELKEAYKQKVK